MFRRRIFTTLIKLPPSPWEESLLDTRKCKIPFTFSLVKIGSAWELEGIEKEEKVGGGGRVSLAAGGFPPEKREIHRMREKLIRTESCQ